MSTSKNGEQFCCTTSTENLIDDTKLFKSYCKFIDLGYKQRTSSTEKYNRFWFHTNKGCQVILNYDGVFTD